MKYDTLMDGMIEIALHAGAIIDQIYHSDFDAQEKADGSAVTMADTQAEALILSELARLAPQIPVLAEESFAQGRIPALGERFFLVDPLDGTREFVNKTDEFTVNIALIEKGVPVIGVIFAPAIAALYFGYTAVGAFRQKIAPGMARPQADPAISISAKPCATQKLVAVASRSHRSSETHAFLQELGVRDMTPAGSSLKFCRIAEGSADVYPRLGRTMEWDTAAGQAIVEAAGGQVLSLDQADNGTPLQYGKAARGFDNPHFIVWAKK